jgi:hemerythrin-like metal-binding protein
MGASTGIGSSAGSARKRGERQPVWKGGLRMKLAWRHDLETGDPQTDRRNQLLVQRLDELKECCRDYMQLQEAADLMSLLKQYMLAHFSAEEHYHALQSYQHRREHAEQHESLISRLSILEAAYLDEGLTMPVVSYSLKFTYEWLTWHIIQWDKEMAVILQSRWQRSARAKNEGGLKPGR